jgi:8-amino-7-oxononanoate synthase
MQMDNPLLESYRNLLENLGKEDLIRIIEDRDSGQGRVIRKGGRELLNFSSNDYLGLASEAPCTDRTGEKHRHGGAGASRLLSGGTTEHSRLEEEIALWKGTEASILFTSGYAANTGAIPALSDEETVIFSDELNHASIIDGCRISRAKKIIYRHLNMKHLRSMLSNTTLRKKIIVTESVFSMDGDIAPVDELTEIASRHEALLYIDDAHATGVLGGGKGSLAEFNISHQSFIIEMGTLSKAVGSLGGFVASTGLVRKLLVNRARSLIYTTALPVHAVMTSLRNIKAIRKSPDLVKRLWKNREYLHSGLMDMKLDTGRSRTPIIPLMLDDNSSALRLSDFLSGRGIYAPAIRYPTVKRPRLRITVTASHQEDDLETLLQALREALSAGLL